MHRRSLLFLLLPAALLAQNGARPTLSAEKIRQIEQLVASEMARTSIPGVSVAIAGKVQFAQGFGMADLENLIPVTPETRIRLGSISKPITATAVLQLVEQHKIDLDAEIQRYVPAFPQKQWPVTVRQLLGHQGGVRHYLQDGTDLDSVVHYTDRVTPLSIFAKDALLFEPGTKYSYTTYGFNLLGAAVEAASGEPLPEYFEKHIFQPAAMDKISIDDSYRIIPHRARGYHLENGNLQNCHLADTSNKIPGGGLISTSGDLVKFALALNAGKLVKPETARMMWTEQKTRDGKATGYGMGFHTEKDSVSHSGGQQGITTNLELFPAENLAIAVMTNLDNARGLQPIARGIAKILHE
jgi:CubicO group peptidase (beta-lactamase class C family)